jgi:hypothetical protein
MTTQPEAALGVLRSRGVVEPVELAIGVGPQLGALAENLENAIGVSYSDLPGFPAIDNRSAKVASSSTRSRAPASPVCRGARIFTRRAIPP